MKIKRALITGAIALIFALFIGYGIEVFHPNTKDLCDVYRFDSESACLKQGGIWNGGDDDLPRMDGCMPDKTCYDNLRVLQGEHDKIVFIVALIFGIAAVFGGMLIGKEVVGDGLLAGGIFLLLYGTIRYWDQANNTLKFILLGVVLAILIWIAYRKIK